LATADHLEISPPFICPPVFGMGKKAVKSARKFAASGQLKKTIEARHKYQQTKKKFEQRRGNKGKSQLPSKVPELDEDEDEEVEGTCDKCALGFYILSPD
jgi:nucleolar complex protein 2